jgi:hypothetical protein
VVVEDILVVVEVDILVVVVEDILVVVVEDILVVVEVDNPVEGNCFAFNLLVHFQNYFEQLS